MDYYAIGQRIRKFRKAHRLSQDELAERIGISVTHMSHIETGNTKLSCCLRQRLPNGASLWTLLSKRSTAARRSSSEFWRIFWKQQGCPLNNIYN